MLDLDVNKTYIVQVLSSGMTIPLYTVAGEQLDITVSALQDKYPLHKKIVIFDIETKDVVAVLK